MKRLFLALVAIFAGVLMVCAFVCLVMAVIYSFMYTTRYLLLIPAGAVIAALSSLLMRWIYQHNGGT